MGNNHDTAQADRSEELERRLDRDASRVGRRYNQANGRSRRITADAPRLYSLRRCADCGEVIAADGTHESTSPACAGESVAPIVIAAGVVQPPAIEVPTCPRCHAPTHASESNDDGVCVLCLEGSPCCKRPVGPAGLCGMCGATVRAPSVATKPAPATCWNEHAAMKADDAVWSSLPFRGIQPVNAIGEDAAYELELRDCDRGCRSTLARRVTP